MAGKPKSPQKNPQNEQPAENLAQPATTDPIAAPTETTTDTTILRPMAVKEPSLEDRMEAAELRIKQLEKLVEEHRVYHFGVVVKT